MGSSDDDRATPQGTGDLLPDDRSVELADGDHREAVRRHATPHRFQPDPLVTQAHRFGRQPPQVRARPATFAEGPSNPHDARAFVRGAQAAITVMFYAGLAALVGALAEWVEDPPTAVTVIIVATFFGALVTNDATVRRP